MHDTDERFSKAGLMIPEIWLPPAGTDLFRWAVIACDQHTSDPEYWKQVEATVGGESSTLSLILPEVFLGQPDRNSRVSAIAKTMRDYQERGVIENRGRMAVLVQRTTPHVPSRTGLILAIDLDRYDFNPDSTSLIRATEGTILDRLPPRVEVRKQVAFELPHVLVLIDDPDRTVVEPAAQEIDQLELLYDTELMLGGGSVRGFAIRDAERLNRIADALLDLNRPQRKQDRYGRADAMLLAVGDGNHSLATARQVWMEKKAGGSARPDDPARFALVEIINLHDPGLQVEPIHRVVTGVNPQTLIEAFLRAGASAQRRCTAEESVAAVLGGTANRFALINPDGAQLFDLGADPIKTPAVLVQNVLERLESAGGHDMEVDYIHGTEPILSLSRQPGHCGLLVPAIRSDSLFRYVANNGPLPRKIFSLGEAEEKRYYFEARKIV